MNKQKIYELFFLVMIGVILMLRIYFLQSVKSPDPTNLIEYQEIVTERFLLQGGKITLNDASKQELMALPGIGPKRAQKILQLRKSLGEFTNIDQLLEVTGISNGVLDQIRPFVVLKATPDGKRP